MPSQITLKVELVDAKFEETNLFLGKTGGALKFLPNELKTDDSFTKLPNGSLPKAINLMSGSKLIASSLKENSLPQRFLDDYLYFYGEGDPIVEMSLIGMGTDKKGWQNIHKSGEKGNIYPNS